MAVSSEYLQYVLEQLSGLGDVSARRMFGGAGLYQGPRFFGLVTSDTLYFKVNDTNRGDYEDRGMKKFQPFPDKPHMSMNYYELPADVLEDADECIAWARKSAAIATVRSKPKSKKANKVQSSASLKRKAQSKR